jgi:hypothetical protein
MSYKSDIIIICVSKNFRDANININFNAMFAAIKNMYISKIKGPILLSTN